jgi:tryptophan 2,3-dioxygenase
VETSPYSHSYSRLSTDRTTEARSTVTVFDRRLRWRQRHALAVWCCAGGGRAAGGVSGLRCVRRPALSIPTPKTTSGSHALVQARRRSPAPPWRLR